MKLYIRQKVFSWKDRFTVKDADGRDCYTVEGEVFTFGRKLHVYDMTGREVIFIEQEVWAWMPRYHVYIQGRHAAEIRRKFTWLKPYYEIIGPDWTAEGYLMDCRITNKGRSDMGSIAKEWMSWGDSYELTIVRPEDELLLLAILLVIDCVADSNNS